MQQFPDTTKQEADTQLHTLLHLGSIDFNQSNDGSIKNHNKFWMVDDHIFYFGSHNIYPSALQQYGVIVDSSEAADKVNNNFWNPMWLNANKMK